MQLGRLTWTDIAGRDDAPLLLIPVGSLEQHGPHLPLDTDTRIAMAVAETGARWLPGALVAPPLAISASGEHQGFPGTLSIGTEAATTVVVEMVRSADWTTGVVLVNGHGGNLEAVSEAVNGLQQEGRHILPWWPRVSGGDAHAGRTETSLMLAIAPELVQLDRAEVGNTADLGELGPRLRERGVRAVSANGILGDPTAATTDDGERLLAELAADLTSAVERWRSG